MTIRKGIIFGLSLAFASMAMFGSFGMMQTGHNHTTCFASIIAKNVCPNTDNAAAVLFHIATFKMFSTAQLLTDPLFVLLIIAAVGVAWALGPFRQRNEYAFAFSPAFFERQKQRAQLSRRREVFWLSRLVHSPTNA